MIRRLKDERTRRVPLENVTAHPVQLHCRRVEWGAIAMILLGVGFLIFGMAIGTAAKH